MPTIATTVALLLSPTTALAGPGDSQGWLHRYRPEPHSGELGLAAGYLRLAERHSLFFADPDRYLLGYKRLRQPNLALGLRGGYYPLRFFGVEVESGFVPARLRDEPGAAFVYSVRGQLVAQLGLWSITPFLLVGAGAIGVASDPQVLGRDLDPALHFGVGLKLAINRWLGVRVEVRDLVSDKQGVESPLAAHHLEVLAGLTLTIRPRPR